MDKLDQIYRNQSKLQQKLKTDYDTQFQKDMILGAIDELCECLREIPWKPWKKKQEYHEERFKEEIVDLLHFLVNLSLSAGMSSDELFERYCNKNKINHERHDSGY